MDMPADALLVWCREHFPAAVEEYIDPAHLGSTDVIAAVRDKLPDLIRQRVRPATAKALTEEAAKNRGLLADRIDRDVVERVATVTPGQVSGAFAFTDQKGPERRARLLAELLAGRLPGVIGFGPVALAAAPEPAAEPPSRTSPSGKRGRQPGMRLRAARDGRRTSCPARSPARAARSCPCLRRRTVASRPVILLVTDPPRREDPPEVQERKARAAAGAWVERLRARGEQVTLVPSPAAGSAGVA